MFSVDAPSIPSCSVNEILGSKMLINSQPDISFQFPDLSLISLHNNTLVTAWVYLRASAGAKERKLYPKSDMNRLLKSAQNIQATMQ